MLVKYMPEGQSVPTEWEFDPDRVRQSDAEIIEKRSGQRWNNWVEDVQAGAAAARRVLLWHLMRRDHHTLRIEDVPDFYMGELTIDYSLADLQKLRQRVLESSVTEEKKVETVQRLDHEIAGRLVKERPDEADLGKAPWSSGG